MPKRRHTNDFKHISRKIKKLERKLKRAKHRNQFNDSTSSSSRSRSLTPQMAEEQTVSELLDEQTQISSLVEPPSELLTVEIPDGESQIEINSPEAPAQLESQQQEDQVPLADSLNPDILEILGIDPSSTVQYGQNIHNELATRLEHISTNGLTKEARKELNERYLIPANCIKIGAPVMNPEIKAAVPEAVMKRDKGIEYRQKQLAAAISGVSAVINAEIENNEKDKARLKKLMDVGRNLCDIQYAESTTRRNFAAFSIRKEIKDHLFNTKIDKTLFGEDLAETLKSAKAVTKSGFELKNRNQHKPKASTSFSPNPNLNWRGPAPAHRLPAPQRNPQGARPPAPAPGHQTRFTRSQTHTNLSKTSQPQFKQTRRR